MKSLYIAITFLPAIASAQVLLTDNFAGSSVNSSLWNTVTPFSDSSVTESGGALSLTNRGQIYSTQSFQQPIQITGQFQFTGNGFDQFTIRTQTDAVSTTPSAEFDNGFRFAIVSKFDNGSTSNNIEIKYTQNFVQMAGISATLPINIGQLYDFKITDDGSTASFFINGTNQLSLTFGNGFGAGLVGFYNREGAAGGSSNSAGSVTAISNLTITAIPEPSVYAGIMGFSALIVGCLTKRKKSAKN